MTRRAVLSMLTFVALWAVLEAVAALTIHSISAWQVVWGRYTVHLLIVLLVWFRPGVAPPWRTRKLHRQLARSAMMLIMAGSFALALGRGAQASAVLAVFWCAPLLICGLARLIGDDRPKPLAVIATALGWVAAWLYYGPTLPSLVTFGLSLTMAFSFAGYVVMTRGLNDEPLSTNLFYTAVVPWVGLLPVMRLTWVAPGPLDLVGVVFVGASGWLALLALDRSATAVPVSQTASMLPFQILVSAALAAAAGQAVSPLRASVSGALLLATLILGLHALPSSVQQERV